MRLVIRLLGTFEATLDDEPLRFESDSARALLAYLAAEPGRAFSRAVVAEMLWPERPQGAALSNLRHVLSVLRRALGNGAELLETDRSTIALRAGPEVWVDLEEFRKAASVLEDQEGMTTAWEQAVALWRGSVLEGLQVRAGAEWEEWLMVLDERVRRILAATLHRLVDHLARTGEPQRALSLAQRLVAVDEWDERAHRHVMRLLAQTGERGQAITYFDRVADRFQAELGVEPGAATAELAGQIRAGELADLPIEIAYPDFLAGPGVTPPLFVGRQRELAILDAHLSAALGGNGRIVLLAGEAGSGKTMLAAEFLRRASEHPGLLVARGRCNAYGGMGDPYLPFREILAMLSGDVATSFASGSLGREQATRLWEAIPETARLVVERGPTLLGTIVTGAPLLQRVEAAVPGIRRLDDLRAQLASAPRMPAPGQMLQPAMFGEYAAVLEGIASTHPLVLLIDDLQWADRGSVALLWHLARRLEGLPVVIVGAYRPEEVTREHALQPVLAELRTAIPDGTIELGTDRGFVDDYLDAEPNDLDLEFRERLFSYTNGHPLFTVEMVRGMQERAEIRRTKTGVWETSESLKWDRLPARVEAAVAQRIARLPDRLQRALAVAAVQGESFLAETVAAVDGDDELPARLTREATSPGRLIAPAEVTRVDSRLVSRHRFRHILFQRYLYDQLIVAERMRLHEATGRALEDLYEGRPELPVADLAYHFDQAGLVEPAIGYLYQAGQRAYAMSANEEAIRLVERAVELLTSLPESTERNQRELELLAALLAPTIAVRGYAAPEAEQIGKRVWGLCERLEPSPPGVMALSALSATHGNIGRITEAVEVSRKALEIAQHLGNPSLQVGAHHLHGFWLTWSGDLAGGHAHHRRACELHDAERDAWMMDAFGEPGVEALADDSLITWFHGYPDQALAMADEAVSRGRRLDHPFTLCYALFAGAASVHWCRGEHQQLLGLAEELRDIATAEHFPYFAAAASLIRGIGTGHLGDPDRGIELIEQGLEAWRAIQTVGLSGFYLAEAANLHHLQGSTHRALELADQVRTEAKATGEGFAEIYATVMRAALLRTAGNPAAEAELQAAIEAAAALGAHSIELRAATELASLYEGQDLAGDARKVLEPIYNRFTEGFDTHDLIAARLILERL